MRALALALLFASPDARAQTPAPGLDFRGALDLAVRNNLAVRLARSRSAASRAQVLQAASALLPSMLAAVSESRVFKVNLMASGFPANGPFNPLVGPFDVFDARLQWVQDLLNVSSIRRYQSARSAASSSDLEEALAREQVAGAAALAYVEARRAQNALQAAQADLDLAAALQKLAEDQHRSGVSAGVDVARARTRAAQAQLKLIQVDAARRRSEIRLKRLVGLPLGEAVRLTDALGSSPAPVPETDASVSEALARRLEARIAASRAEADELALKAASGQRIPVVTVNANYGSSGNLPNSAARATGAIGAGVRLPLFTGGLIAGQIQENAARAAQSFDAREDQRAQIEEDVRLSLDSLKASLDQVQTADQVVSLSERELKLAKDRFAAGVGDNIELVNAQDSLASARDAQVAALSEFHIARINMALALGRMGEFRL